MVTRLAEEKESKGREGMKMMGLSDSTYYAGWFIFNGLIVTFISVLIVSNFAARNILLIKCCAYAFYVHDIRDAVIWFFIFPCCFVTFKKASATAASIIHLSTYYVVYMYKGYGSSLLEKVLVGCFCPNVALGFMLDHLLHCEIEGGTGLTLETAIMPYQSFNFIIGLAC